MFTNADQVEIFAGTQRRRRYTAEQKMAVVVRERKDPKSQVQHAAC
jgi:hypothetical protein